LLAGVTQSACEPLVLRAELRNLGAQAINFIAGTSRYTCCGKPLQFLLESNDLAA
jgi:hypothetical protein